MRLPRQRPSQRKGDFDGFDHFDVVVLKVVTAHGTVMALGPTAEQTQCSPIGP
jgi:hypothetical protein